MAVSKKPNNTAIPTDGTGLSVSPVANVTYAQGIAAKNEWDTAYQTQYSEYYKDDDLIDPSEFDNALSALADDQMSSGYREYVADVSLTGSPQTQTGQNLRESLVTKDSAVWYIQMGRKYFNYFIKMIQNKIEREPERFTTSPPNFDDIFRLNNALVKEVVMLPGKFMNPVTRTRFSKEEYDRHIELLDAVRISAKALYDSAATQYATYVIGTGRNYPNK